MNSDRPRLIEVAFPLKQASLDSVHEKNVRHGHISTLHIWPARRPLAASRAALIATLLPDPGNEVDRKRLIERLGGIVKSENTFKDVGGRKVPTIKEYTEGGILHWGRESDPDMDYFRGEIKKAYGGRAPRVLDPFAGGGAIPLEAMRLGCEVTAADINPVAWFILKCTLEYPQRLAGQTRHLPRFALESPEFMTAFWKAKGTARRGRKQNGTQPSLMEAPEADLSWHVRAWGHWVLEHARKDLERFYPTVDGKSTVAYLWARTVTCKNCRATLPLLKTLWLCRKGNKRFRLEVKPRADRTGVDFDAVAEPIAGGNAAQRRAHDQNVGRGTMSRSGAWCPVCGGPGMVAMTLDDIRAESRAGRTDAQMTAVVADGQHGKEYRAPTADDIVTAKLTEGQINALFRDIPFGPTEEPTPGPFGRKKYSSSLHTYGLMKWCDLFTSRQIFSLGVLVKHTRAARVAMRDASYPIEWIEAIGAYLALVVDRLAGFNSTLCTWNIGPESIRGSFARFAFATTWDFVEINPFSEVGGGYPGALDAIAQASILPLSACKEASKPIVFRASATGRHGDPSVDVVITDPPYYDAIPYSDLMDFFYIWLRRMVHDLSAETAAAFSSPLGPKWDHEQNDGELIDDAMRFGGDPGRSKKVYEAGMHKSFQACHKSLPQDGKMVVVFANKQPDAWETLASSIIRAGFVVDGSWPIMTEREARTRALGSAALSSSVWLVCRKRPEAARPGWDTQVLEEMRANIYDKMRGFWDAGIRGPDFVWAATGPALEAYSKHPVVKKADEPNSLMTVSEFLSHVRRMVVDYVVGRILSRNGNGQAASTLDDMTLYYLLHRHDFGLAEAPVGASILYAQSCNLNDRDLVDRLDLLAYGKSKAAAEAEADEEEDDVDEEGGQDGAEVEEEATSGSTVRLKRWDQRSRKELGMAVGGRVAPLIDQTHRIMRLWRAGDVQQVDAYIEDQGLRRHPVFPRLLQALIELAGKDNQPDERVLLESIMNHVTARGAHPQMRMGVDSEE